MGSDDCSLMMLAVEYESCCPRHVSHSTIFSQSSSIHKGLYWSSLIRHERFEQLNKGTSAYRSGVLVSLDLAGRDRIDSQILRVAETGRDSAGPRP